jgi:hypothetical protein
MIVEAMATGRSIDEYCGISRIWRPRTFGKRWRSQRLSRKVANFRSRAAAPSAGYEPDTPLVDDLNRAGHDACSRLLRDRLKESSALIRLDPIHLKKSALNPTLPKPPNQRRHAFPQNNLCTICRFSVTATENIFQPDIC